VLYEQAGPNSFGRNQTLVCPHYIADGGRCGVWRHRDSTCATWFCKHVRGGVGFHFWRNALHQLLTAVEDELCRWSVLELNLDDDVLRQLFAAPKDKAEADALTGEALDNRVDSKTYAQIWGEWAGREHEFYVACSRLVDPLSWKDVLAISGSEVRALAHLTLKSYQQLTSDEVAPALKVGVMELVQITRDTARVITYSPYDPVEIPAGMMELLPYFDGRPTADALAAIANQKDVRIDPSLVRKMADFALLVPPEN